MIHLDHLHPPFPQSALSLLGFFYKYALDPFFFQSLFPESAAFLLRTLPTLAVLFFPGLF